MSVIKPVITQAAINQPAEPRSFNISALTINIPEPIIDPATIIVASNNPRERLKDLSSCIASLGVKISSAMVDSFAFQDKQNPHQKDLKEFSAKPCVQDLSL